jgi:hypothetical protein
MNILTEEKQNCSQSICNENGCEIAFNCNKTVESFLTTPEDRDRVNRWKPEQFAPELTEKETIEAMKELNVTDFTDKFRKVDRTYSDPPVSLQKYGLISFIPAKDAIPNKNGVFGYAKLRGNYDTEIEANQRAEYIIRKVDSFNKVFHAYVGRPFPITIDSKFSKETSEIDIKKDVTENISHSIKKTKDSDDKIITEMVTREQELLKDSKKAINNEPLDEYDTYITLQVKKAQLSWTYLEHQKKMKEVKDIIMKTRKEIEELDEKHTEFKNNYYEKYKQAREAAGLENESKDNSYSNFLKYMVEDADLGF